MCEENCRPASNCRCDIPKRLKLEVGKIYLNRKEQKVRILCLDGRVNVCGDSVLPVVGLVTLGNGNEKVETYSLTGSYSFASEHMCDIIKEYVEPVVHRRDVVWYRESIYSSHINCQAFKVGYVLSNCYIEVHRQTVEYTETK